MKRAAVEENNADRVSADVQFAVHVTVMIMGFRLNHMESCFC